MSCRAWQQLTLVAMLVLYSLAGRSDVCDLAGADDAELQQALFSVLAAQDLDDAVRSGDLAVSLLLLDGPSQSRLAQVNGHRMIYAASLPKIAILLGAAIALDEKKLELNPALEQDIHDMIRFSCNECSNRVLDLVGRERVLDILQDPKYGFYDEAKGGGLWLGKDYGPSPAYRRDPMAGLSHAATTFQVTRFYCALHRGNLASPEQTQLMLNAMSETGINHKFVKGLAGQDDLQIYRKSGTWRDYHADSALIEANGRTYVMVALAQSADGAAWLERLAAPLHELAVSSTSRDGA